MDSVLSENSRKISGTMEVSWADLAFTSVISPKPVPRNDFFCMFLLEEEKVLDSVTLIYHLDR